jgi:primosomal protein N'
MLVITKFHYTETHKNINMKTTKKKQICHVYSVGESKIVFFTACLSNDFLVNSWKIVVLSSLWSGVFSCSLHSAEDLAQCWRSVEANCTLVKFC